MGYQALTTNVDGSGNTAVGKNSLQHFEADAADHGENTAIGHTSGRFVSTGTQNTFVGNQAGLGITGTKLTGNNNTAIGNSAGLELEGAAHSNTFVGSQAGNTTEAGIENTCIGYLALAEDDTAENQIVIGNNITGTGDSRVHIGNNTGHYHLDYEGSGNSWTHSSDVRIKKDINDDNLGLDFINQLRTVTYKMKPKSEYPEEFQEYDSSNTSSSDKIHYGFVAQEVKEAINKMDADYFTGWSENEDGMQGIGFASFVVPLVKAVQELSAQVEELKNK